MDRKVIDSIVWWIPIKSLRNNLRDLLLHLSQLEHNLEDVIRVVEYNIKMDTKNSSNRIVNLLTSSISMSEFGQDIEAYIYLKCRKSGFYVDIGAHDGMSGSNTYFFENLPDANWRGVLIEPNPDVFKTLKKNRRSDCYNIALSDKEVKDAKYIKISGHGEMLSGLYSSMSNWAKSRIERECTPEKSKIQYIDIETTTFDDIMKNYPNITYIDYMSLDVEGGEVPILNSIDFKKYKFGIISIEMGAGVFDIMIKNGYKFYKQLGCDYLFIPSDMDSFEN